VSKNYYSFITFVVFALLQLSCDSEQVYVDNPEDPVSPVVFDPEATPFNKLSDFNFFEGDIKNLSPVYGVLPYEPINALFTDYAHKKRFVWMPAGSKASYVNDYSVLEFPIGSVLIKNFYYDNILPSNTQRIIETRLMYNTNEGWEFANYIWNDEQTEAFFDMEGSYTDVSFIEGVETKNTTYRIPSGAECFTCHKSGANSIPIGVKPQNLNKSILFEDGLKNQFDKWVEVGYLEGNLPANIDNISNWEDASASLNDRMRGYVDINCAHCHSDNRHCDYRPVRFAFGDYLGEESLGACIDPETQVSPYSKIVEPGNVQRSLMHFRLSTTQEEYRMPLLGRTLAHDEGVLLLEEWIASLTITCD